jgi:hypothetical protein
MKRIRCRCGKILGLPDSKRAHRIRCPGCGATFRVRDAAAEAAPESTSDDYAVVGAADESKENPDERPVALGFIPTPEPRQAPKGRATAKSVLLSASLKKSDESVEPEDFPGPFLDRSAFLYAWLHPTWACWLGLAVMTELTLCAVGCTAFFFTIIMTFGAFVSLFTFASMVMVCVGLGSYVLATFETVLEQTANGGNRLQRLPGYVWYELLPSLSRVFGAAACSVGIAVGITYSCRETIGAWYTPQSLILNDIIAFFLFPIFMISNSVEQSFLPIWALFSTLPRLIRCGGYFLVFLIVSGIVWAMINALIVALLFWHFAAALAAAGPLLAMWLLYYGHWLGRVVRQMMALD